MEAERIVSTGTISGKDTSEREKRLVRVCGNSWVSNLVVIDKAMNEDCYFS